MPLESLRPPEPARIFPPRRDYASLSIKDLLDARDAYHVYLSMLNNVLATAVGRYFIHQDDWYAKHPPNDPRPPLTIALKAPFHLHQKVASQPRVRYTEAKA